MTNILVEGGGQLMGTLLDADQIDEVHVFVAPKIVGGENARSPIDGEGVAEIARAFELDNQQWQQVGPDLYLSGRIRRVQGSG
jgi:diaminohydroxyphosphoribosylaminopyrimidine deaminase/5-amino-6-(5-phosphoribosylamino)uracil reductase